MSTFNRFCAKARNAAEQASQKIEGWVDSAADNVKKKALQIRIDEQYEKLGRVIYRDLHTDENLEEEKLQIIAAIDALYDKLAVLEEDEAADEEEQNEKAEEKADVSGEEQSE